MRRQKKTQQADALFATHRIRTLLYCEFPMHIQSLEHGLIKSRLSARARVSALQFPLPLGALHANSLRRGFAAGRARMVIADGHNMHMFTITCNSSIIRCDMANVGRPGGG